MASQSRDDEALLALRRSWKFASVCQFLFTFDEVLQLDGFQTQMNYISWLFKVLLQFLTQSKTITQDNWAEAFRLQWSIRAMPAVQPLLGTEEKPVAWESLDILEKQLGCLFELCEWQLEKPERLRRLVESEEETISWVCAHTDEKRVNPAGWDREGNTYWLFDDNRMWIQRVPPNTRPKPPPKKRKTTKKAAPPPSRARPAGRRSLRLSGAHAEMPTQAQSDIQADDVFGSDSELSQPPEEPPAWIEFETICITKSDWLAFCERFATSKHPDERSLFNYISKEVLPKILEVIHSEEKKAAMEAALFNRKRSSRIAMRDSEREQREREEMELREQRARAQAALQAEKERLAREEAEAAARRTREDRMRERAERLLIRERMLAKREEAWRRSEERVQPAAQSPQAEHQHSASEHAIPSVPSPDSALPAMPPTDLASEPATTKLADPSPGLSAAGLGLAQPPLFAVQSESTATLPAQPITTYASSPPPGHDLRLCPYLTAEEPTWLLPAADAAATLASLACRRFYGYACSHDPRRLSTRLG
ncbi:DNA-directed RNA polymerase [Malassezia nana]|uniref:DNA-directed RNA polymerase n=1 Tax=Malassezia nana TaxID=180528 RepID=A0AAF0EI84_9BASI|nr:DNA-directed RNA polymerase [Malassezia nana]